jgi:hypothetical protein
MSGVVVEEARVEASGVAYEHAGERPAARSCRGLRSPVRMCASACYARDLPGDFDQPVWLMVEGPGGRDMSGLDPSLVRSRGPSGEVVLRVGVACADDYLDFLSGRCRPNTVLAAAYDLRIFLSVLGKDPIEAVPAARAGTGWSCALEALASSPRRTGGRTPRNCRGSSMDTLIPSNV